MGSEMCIRDRYRTLLHTIIGRILSESVMSQNGFTGIGTSLHTLLILIRSIGSLWAHRYTSIIECLPKETLNSRTFQHAHPSRIVSKPRIRTTLDTQIGSSITIPIQWAISHTVTSGYISKGIIWTGSHTNSCHVISISSIC